MGWERQVGVSEQTILRRRRRRRRRVSSSSVGRRRSSVVPAKSEFRDMDRTNRCRITRSTFLSKEVGSDSLILEVGQPFRGKEPPSRRRPTLEPGNKFLRVY